MDFNGLQVLGWVMMAAVLVCVVMSVLLLVKPGRFRWAYWVAMPTGLSGIGALVYIALYMFAFNAVTYGWVYLIIGIILLLNLIMASSTYWGWGKKRGKHSAHAGARESRGDDTGDAPAKGTGDDDAAVNAASSDNAQPHDDDASEPHDDAHHGDTDVWNVVRSTSGTRPDADGSTDNAHTDAQSSVASSIASASDDTASGHPHDAADDDDSTPGSSTPETVGASPVSRERNPFA